MPDSRFPNPLQSALAEVYQGVFSHPFESFKEATLRRLRALLPFDSAVWGSGLHSTNEMLSVSVVDLAAPSLMAYAAEWQEQDFVRNAAVSEPGRAFRPEDLMRREDYERTDIYRQYSKPVGIEHSLGIVDRNPTTDIGELIFLFRADPGWPFGDAERDLVEALAPHLIDAWGQSQIAHHYRAAADGSASGFHGYDSYAVADAAGVLHASGQDFTRALRAIAPGWLGPRLPPQLEPLQRGGLGTLNLGDDEFTVWFLGDRRLFAVAPRRGTFGLSPAEARVARLYAGGARQRDIARQLGVSVSTVRNQLASVYLKLDVHSKLELLRAVNRMQG
ncbi:MAG: helix-turn-helix transcriptional regulator [Phenylobacterium sp.]|uniref:helix-turn-helix transcriptional regulator n=1 Tax=Phenylobacterium sp. TaxID=1871053 RepID=UPI001A27EB90|nr:LuxR C-terminal-related transcriptional regulator [Phenylobacterium sp.]MBJ7411786.1 helix-turn-helix transcriptional regulator [Phenylobacterium sp.]